MLWILAQISIKNLQKLPLFAFTRPAYVVTLPENVRGKFYVDPIADSKIGVYLPDDFLIGRKSPTNYSSNVDNEANFVRTRPSLDLSINRELTPEFRLRIKGSLKKTNERTNLETFTEVTVRILDENDLSPLFVPQTYKIQVNENTPLYSSLIQVVAKDPDEGLNGEVYYSLQDPSEFFDLRIGRPVYFLPFKKHRIHALAIPPTLKFHFDLTFNIEIRDDCPKFKRYETLPSFFKVDQCTIDGFVGFVDDKLIDQCDNLIFTILGENDNFALKSENGLITLKVKFFAKSQNYTFLVKVDSLKCRTFEPLIYNVTIFVESCNYRLPRFVSSTCSSIIANPSALISSNPVIPLCKVEAVDEDSNKNGLIFYSIRTRDANVQQIFKIHPENGEFDVNISLSKEISDVNVVKNDRVTTHYAKNIYVPIFVNESAKVIYINESAQPNHIVTTFEARDADAGAAGFVRYGIMSGNENGYFKIDTYTGHLIAHKVLDREKQDSFELKIEARDSGFPETKFEHRSFVIKLLDVNDNRPFFKQSSYVFNIPENSLAGVIVGQVMAIDCDENENARLTYRLASTSNIFHLEENSGEIAVKTPILNREEKDEYKLTIVASDNGRPPLSSSTVVTILISDINDNLPKIPSLKRAKLAEDLPLNSLISCLDGYDEDLGENGTVVYQLIDDQSQSFSIDRETGCLKLIG
uniref:Cadherin domain-containing protein n=1 Tax=Romanomermis culicivorax TaxID=13658 RepID=A0A915HYX5_ROMCU